MRYIRTQTRYYKVTKHSKKRVSNIKYKNWVKRQLKKLSLN